MSIARAQVWQGEKNFDLTEVALPSLGAGEVLVELEVATVCGSDRHTVSGRRSGASPSVLGHEGTGTVVDSRREGIDAGDRVVFSVTAVCHECQNCRRGLTAKCERVRKVGHERFEEPWLLSGTYATHIHLLAGVAVEKLPESVEFARASTAGCAIATVMAMIDAAGDLNGRTVLVNGLGMLGITAVVAARAGGAERIIACDPNEAARVSVGELADDVVAEVIDQTVDVSFELSGVAAGVQTCIDVLEVGGTAVLAGTVAPVPDAALDPEWLVRGWRTVTGVHNYEPRHLGQAVQFLVKYGDELPWDSVLGQRYSLGELPLAFIDGGAGARAVVDMTL